MRAFISYSLNDSEQYVLSILSQRLQGQGFVVSSSYHLFAHSLDYETFTQLNQSNLFIGLITASGDSNDRVFAEWQQAFDRNIPSVLLVENTVSINRTLVQNGNVVVFDRHNPLPALDFIRQQMSTSQSVPMVQTTSNKAAWIFGGLAALAIIGLLASGTDE